MVKVPVASMHVGWVMLPTSATAGAPGASWMTTSVDGDEVNPAAFVTVKLYVPVARSVTFVLVPVPVIAPGLIVQLPAGKPFNTTLPVVTEQVGWLIVPTVGDADCSSLKVMEGSVSENSRTLIKS